MTDKYEDLRKAAQKATRGPWAVGKYLGQRSDEWSVFLRTPKGENGLPVVTTMFDLANATYVAAVNPKAILELLATNERLVDEVDSLKAARIAYASEFPPIPDGDDAGLPAVDRIHENIRRLKAENAELKQRVAGLEANEKVLLAQVQGHTQWREKIINASVSAYGESAIRYKFSLTKSGKCMNTFPREIDGRWFALTPAEDDGHIGHIARIQGLTGENAELKAKLTEKASLLRGCYAADHKQKQRIEELIAERDALKAELEAMKIAASPAKWWKCSTHGQAKAGAWGCPECVSEMRAELERIKALDPVAWALRFNGDSRLCLSCVFDTEKEANEYAEQINHIEEVVPLYALGSKT